MYCFLDVDMNVYCYLDSQSDEGHVRQQPQPLVHGDDAAAVDGGSAGGGVRGTDKHGSSDSGSVNTDASACASATMDMCIFVHV